MYQAVKFGAKNSLVGVLTLPEESAPTRDIGVIFLNAGLLHRVGPFRMNAELANVLAMQGYKTLRFDSSSIGDSGATSSESDYLQSVTQDIESATDLMVSRTGLSRFVVFGLCTGADNAHRAMVNDKRLIGGIFLDGYSYPTMKFRVKRYLPVLLSLPRLLGALSRIKNSMLGKLSGSANRDTVESSSSMFTWQLPGKEKTKDEIRIFIERDAKLLYIFTGGANEVYNYENQFVDSMPFLKKHKGQITVILNQKTDHTFCLYHDRLWLYEKILNWLEFV
jgi:hypothetical protein